MRRSRTKREALSRWTVREDETERLHVNKYGQVVHYPYPMAIKDNPLNESHRRDLQGKSAGLLKILRSR